MTSYTSQDWVNSIKGVKPSDQFIALDRRLFEDCIARVIKACTTPPASEPATVGVREAALIDAGQAVLDRMFSTYKARNGREVGIQGDDGEKCWIVHSDNIEELRRCVAALTPNAVSRGDGA